MRFLKSCVFAIAALAFLATPLFAQVPSAPQPVVQGTQVFKPITMASQGAASISSADITKYGGRGLWCALNQSAHSSDNGQSTTFSILGKEEASGAYISLITSAATTADATPNWIMAHPLAVASSNKAAAAYVPRTFRISVTVAGTTTPTVSGTVGCQSIQ